MQTNYGIATGIELMKSVGERQLAFGFCFVVFIITRGKIGHSATQSGWGCWELHPSVINE